MTSNKEIIKNINNILLQLDEREVFVPRFKGKHLETGEKVEGAGCYTNENGKTFIIEDDRSELGYCLTPVKEIKYDWNEM